MEWRNCTVTCRVAAVHLRWPCVLRESDGKFKDSFPLQLCINLANTPPALKLNLKRLSVKGSLLALLPPSLLTPHPHRLHSGDVLNPALPLHHPLRDNRLPWDFCTHNSIETAPPKVTRAPPSLHGPHLSLQAQQLQLQAPGPARGPFLVPGEYSAHTGRPEGPGVSTSWK